jgi:CheY-like chemotaxis protein
MSTSPSAESLEAIVQLTRGQLLDLVLDIEQRLRTVVRSVLSEKTPDWLKLIPTSIRNELRAKKGGHSDNDLLDRADLGQLAGIVLNRWADFADLLGPDKPALQVKLDEFRAWRNFLAHGKQPSTDDKLEIAVVLRQVGAKIPALPVQPAIVRTTPVQGTRVLWMDDHPEWSLRERQILEMLGIQVVPALANDEAVALAVEHPFDLVISDIHRDEGETGAELPERLADSGSNAPIIFYVGVVRDGGPPGGAVAITADPAILVRDALVHLSNG